MCVWVCVCVRVCYYNSTIIVGILYLSHECYTTWHNFWFLSRMRNGGYINSCASRCTQMLRWLRSEDFSTLWKLMVNIYLFMRRCVWRHFVLTLLFRALLYCIMCVSVYVCMHVRCCVCNVACLDSVSYWYRMRWDARFNSGQLLFFDTLFCSSAIIIERSISNELLGHLCWTPLKQNSSFKRYFI